MAFPFQLEQTIPRCNTTSPRLPSPDGGTQQKNKLVHALGERGYGRIKKFFYFLRVVASLRETSFSLRSCLNKTHAKTRRRKVFSLSFLTDNKPAATVARRRDAVKTKLVHALGERGYGRIKIFPLSTRRGVFARDLFFLALGERGRERWL